MDEKTTSELKQIIKSIENEQILLPNFQREFTWRDEKMQIELVCSVLARMPVGSILLLKSTEREFGCRKIGLKVPAQKDEDNSEVQYLLDGQQRLTVLSNVFSPEADTLEAHHLLPVGSYKEYEQNSAEIRGNDKHLCNSPVNFVYILPRTNKDIGKEDLPSYISRISDAAKASLHISGSLTNEICSQLIDDNNSSEKRLEIAHKILAERFDLIKGTVEKRIKTLLGVQ